MAELMSFFAHGSRWVRADFHLHTRRDKEFKDVGAEQDFVVRYIDAMNKAGIRVGVITNHNKFDRDEFKLLRKVAKKDDIYLMPGVELSVKDGRNGIHTLVIFSDDWVDNRENADHISGFLGVTFTDRQITTTAMLDQTMIFRKPFANLKSSKGLSVNIRSC